MPEEKLIITPEFLKAIHLVTKGEDVFVHGKPGTGKSTFINLVREALSRLEVSSAVITPTGIAALNVKGQTIHSFLWLSPYNINEPLNPKYKFPLLRRLRNVDVLIIDEVSMVRADLFDAIDKRMRDLFETKTPFAGKQIVLVGDLYQLDPVVDEDSELLQDKKFLEDYGAEGSFIFNSKIYKNIDFKHINFTHIFRQKETEFIKHLDTIRSGSGADIKESLEFFNKKVTPIQPEGIISLCAKKKDALVINNRKLAQLPGKEYTISSMSSDEKSGRKDWEEKNCPAPKTLRLKKDAVVMITQNDEASTKRYVNGTIGTVKGIIEENGNITAIEVLLQHGSVLIERITWFKMKLDERGKQVEDTDKFYTQFPFSLPGPPPYIKRRGLRLIMLILTWATALLPPGKHMLR
ncbi:ATP-dependent exoDNAse (exonuclease V) alpha subunit [Elusimicrobium posterum]|uniref:ATP-dependent DNA helicase n=1 Tax=Elusimicrobium posterum TaxID=3116653 RepID=UPI003C7831B0